MYIVHQTLIVVIAHAIQPAKLAPVIEALVLIVLTLCLSFAVVEVARRSRLLRPLSGIAPVQAPVKTQRSSQDVTTQ